MTRLYVDLLGGKVFIAVWDGLIEVGVEAESEIVSLVLFGEGEGLILA